MQTIILMFDTQQRVGTADTRENVSTFFSALFTKQYDSQSTGQGTFPQHLGHYSETRALFAMLMQ